MDTRQSKLVGTSHELQFGVHGSRIRSIQGNVDPDSRVATDEDDVLEILERESDEHAVLRLQDIRSVNGNVFGTFIIDDEINAGGLPGSPTDGTYALVTATWTTYTKNEIWRWSAEKAAWVKLSIQFGKFMIVRKSGGITGYSEGVLYYYNSDSDTWTSISGSSGVIPTPEIFEVDSGIVSSKVITLASAPPTNAEEVSVNGLVQLKGVGYDYTISGDTITFDASVTLTVGDKIYVTRKA